MDLAEDHMQRAFKRRRFHPDTVMEGLSENATISANTSAPFLHGKALLSSASGQSSSKRLRKDVFSAGGSYQSSELQRVVESQATEIQYLKTAKINLEATLNGLKSEHEKTLNESRILKRAVAIQQERQSQTAQSLEQARLSKIDSDKQIKSLEQMVLSLRYHLQALQPRNTNDFMGHQPPDVY